MKHFTGKKTALIGFSEINEDSATNFGSIKRF